ncbi:MAG: nitroreductase [Ruminococcaceae bacterium]|nr:nitroreductase [Oscillospiraceae bacterium]
MKFEDLLNERRSIRNFDGDKVVTKEQVVQIVESAVKAPSWKNLQTSRYYCVLSDEMLKNFLSDCLPSYNAKSARGAALVVTTFISNCSGYDLKTGNPENECGNGWGYYDLGLQNENFILKAKELGLDTLIMGLRDSDKIRELIKIPEEETVVSVIALGYASEKPKKTKRKDVEEILKFL